MTVQYRLEAFKTEILNGNARSRGRVSPIPAVDDEINSRMQPGPNNRGEHLVLPTMR